MNYDDINKQLADMMIKEKREAFDAGALSILDTVIKLSEMSGGRLSTRNLRDYKNYIESNFERMHDEEKRSVQPEEADPEVRSVSWRIDPQVVELDGPESSVGSDSPAEEAQPESGQGGEAVTQAE